MVKPDSKIQVFPIYDTYGGKKIIELPPDGHIKGLGTKLDRLISPDGQWLVFYTGTTHYIDSKTELPLTLKLLNIKDGTIKTVADVVTDGSKKKLDELAEILKKLDPEKYKPQYYNAEDDGNWVGGGLVTALEWGIYATAWSPNGHTLAFAAQIDGLSSDVYLYDLETGKVQHAEDSLQNITDIRWSPDGQKIIFENTEPGFGYMGASELYAINYQKETVKNPKRLTWGSWIGSYDPITQTWLPTGDVMPSNLLLVTYNTPDAGSSGIKALDITTGQLAVLWEHIFGDYAVDPENKTILVGPSDFTSQENQGIYQIASNGRKTQIFSGLYYVDMFYRGGKKHRFILQGISESEIGGNSTSNQYPIAGQIIAIDQNGKPASFAQYDHKPNISISPDLSWLLIYNESTLNLYDKNDELVKTFEIGGIERIIWRPDSQAIFYSIEDQLYILVLPTGEPQKIGESNIEDAIWLP
jgi:WD40 repeat protein